MAIEKGISKHCEIIEIDGQLYTNDLSREEKFDPSQRKALKALGMVGVGGILAACGQAGVSEGEPISEEDINLGAQGAQANEAIKATPVVMSTAVMEQGGGPVEEDENLEMVELGRNSSEIPYFIVGEDDEEIFSELEKEPGIADKEIGVLANGESKLINLKPNDETWSNMFYGDSEWEGLISKLGNYANLENLRATGDQNTKPTETMTQGELLAANMRYKDDPFVDEEGNTFIALKNIQIRALIGRTTDGTAFVSPFIQLFPHDIHYRIEGETESDEVLVARGPRKEDDGIPEAIGGSIILIDGSDLDTYNPKVIARQGEEIVMPIVNDQVARDAIIDWVNENQSLSDEQIGVLGDLAAYMTEASSIVVGASIPEELYAFIEEAQLEAGMTEREPLPEGMFYVDEMVQHLLELGEEGDSMLPGVWPRGEKVVFSNGETRVYEVDGKETLVEMVGKDPETTTWAMSEDQTEPNVIEPNSKICWIDEETGRMMMEYAVNGEKVVLEYYPEVDNWMFNPEFLGYVGNGWEGEFSHAYAELIPDIIISNEVRATMLGGNILGTRPLMDQRKLLAMDSPGASLLLINSLKLTTADNLGELTSFEYDVVLQTYGAMVDPPATTLEEFVDRLPVLNPIDGRVMGDRLRETFLRLYDSSETNRIDSLKVMEDMGGGLDEFDGRTFMIKTEVDEVAQEWNGKFKYRALPENEGKAAEDGVLMVDEEYFNGGTRFEIDQDGTLVITEYMAQLNGRMFYDYASALNKLLAINGIEGGQYKNALKFASYGFEIEENSGGELVGIYLGMDSIADNIDMSK